MWSYETIPPSTEAEIDEGILRLDEAFVKILGVKPKFLRCAPKSHSLMDGFLTSLL